MKISVIIPVYKVEKYIESCVDSVLRQSFRDMEVILVDDCSPDGSMVMAKNYIESSPLGKDISFIYLKHDHNRGLSAARNTGMEVAKGDYIFFLDSDDTITYDCLEKLSSTLNEEWYDLVVGNIKTIGDDNTHEFLRLKLGPEQILRDYDIQKTYRKQWNMMAQNKLYRTEFLRKEGLTFMEGLIHEDELWSMKVACLAKSLRAVSDYTYNYYKREGSIISTSSMERHNEMFKRIVIEMSKFLNDRKIFSAPIYQILKRFLYQILLKNKSNQQKFLDTYVEFRVHAHFPLLYRIKANGCNIKHQVAEIHYFMPTGLMFFLFRVYFYLKRL